MKTTKKPSLTPLFPFWVTWTTYLFCFPWNCISSICLFSAAKYNPALDRPPPTYPIDFIGESFFGVYVLLCTLHLAYGYLMYLWLNVNQSEYLYPFQIPQTFAILRYGFLLSLVWLIIYRNKKYWLVLFVVVNLFFTIFSTVFFPIAIAEISLIHTKRYLRKF